MVLTPLLALTDLLTDGTGYLPAHWICPIQEGLPILLNAAKNILVYMAAFSFFGGISATIMVYLLAFGNEEKAKKAKDVFKSTLLGAVLVMASAFIVNEFANSLLEPGQGVSVFNFEAPDYNKPVLANDDSRPQCSRKQPELGTPSEREKATDLQELEQIQIF